MIRYLLLGLIFYMVFKLVKQLIIGKQLGGSKPFQQSGRRSGGRFDHIQDADFEEIKDDPKKD